MASPHIRTPSLVARLFGGTVLLFWLLLLLEYRTELGDRWFVVFVIVACVGLCIASRFPLIGPLMTFLAVTPAVLLKETTMWAVILLVSPAIVYSVEYLFNRVHTSQLHWPPKRFHILQ